MKKTAKPAKKNVSKKETSFSKVNEAMPPYQLSKSAPVLKDFTYGAFRKIADKAGFSLAEWAAILHVSERTLQRYAKNNGHFAAINAERALQIDKILNEGKIAFGSYENFCQWLKGNPSMLEGNLSVASLTTLDGIEKVSTQLSRIQHGLFA